MHFQNSTAQSINDERNIAHGSLSSQVLFGQAIHRVRSSVPPATEMAA